MNPSSRRKISNVRNSAMPFLVAVALIAAIGAFQLSKGNTSWVGNAVAQQSTNVTALSSDSMNPTVNNSNISRNGNINSRALLNDTLTLPSNITGERPSLAISGNIISDIIRPLNSTAIHISNVYPSAIFTWGPRLEGDCMRAWGTLTFSIVGGGVWRAYVTSTSGLNAWGVSFEIKDIQGNTMWNTPTVWSPILPVENEPIGSSTPNWTTAVYVPSWVYDAWYNGNVGDVLAWNDC
jgi:hypothetical protein